MVLLPGTAFAAAAVPSGNGNNFFANGTAITIADQKRMMRRTLPWMASPPRGTDAYIIWEEAALKTIGVNGTKVSVSAEATAAPLLLRYPEPASP